MGLKAYFQQRALTKEENNNSRLKLLKNYQEIKSILVLCSVKSDDEIKSWKVYFDNLSTHIKKIDTVFFIDDKSKKPEDTSSDECIHIYPYQINWFGNLKEKEKFNEIHSFPYDLLIDLNFNNHFVLNLSFVKSVAGLKVGSYHRKMMSKYTDLIIKTDSAEQKQKLYIDQVFYYLRQINSNGSS